MQDSLAFPDGIRIICVKEIGKDTPSIESSVVATRYEIHLCPPHPLPSPQGGEGGGEGDRVLSSVSRFHASISVPFVHRRGEKTVNIDLKHYITELVVDGEGVIGMTLNERIPMIRVNEALAGIFGMFESEFQKNKIRKIGIIFKDNRSP